MLEIQETDLRLRYLLGELTAAEQAEIEEHYFKDDEFFETIVNLEKELIEEGEQASSRVPAYASDNQSIKMKLEKLPETEFAKQWLADISEVIGPSAPEENEAGLVKSIAYTTQEVYQPGLRDVERQLRERETEERLAKAWEDRELASTLFYGEWMGLRILSELKAGASMKASSLAEAAGADLDLLAPLLVRLVRFGAVEEEDNLFAITRRGSTVIRNLENAAGVSL